MQGQLLGYKAVGVRSGGCMLGSGGEYSCRLMWVLHLQKFETLHRPLPVTVVAEVPACMIIEISTYACGGNTRGQEYARRVDGCVNTESGWK